jgi:catechol 2,3-dioxygenase-like lactoylglutathione lyase family enzyme
MAWPVPVGVERDYDGFEASDHRRGRPTRADGDFSMALSIDALDHLVVNVANPEASAAWYGRVLGMSRQDFDPGHGAATRISMKFGVQKINLRPVSASKADWFTADHEAAGSDDLCFLTTSSPDAVVSHLRACGVAIEQGPIEKRGARGVIISVYCRDPDGSLIEIASYPA